jgi:hypothetical protein
MLYLSFAGAKFVKKIDKAKLAQLLSELVQDLNRGPLVKQTSIEVQNGATEHCKT